MKNVAYKSHAINTQSVANSSRAFPLFFHFFAIVTYGVKVNFYFRLYREALKQSATDPMSGKIDVSILTTGMSSATRKRRVEVAASVKKLIQGKGKVTTIQTQKLFSELKETSDLVSRS